jgi:hypothetical protein
MLAHPPVLAIEVWHIDRFIPYARNPRKNDAAVDRMAASIREFGFKIPSFGNWSVPRKKTRIEATDDDSRETVGEARRAVSLRK